MKLRSARFQSLHTGAGLVALQGLAFLTSILIARGLGPELQGRFQLVMSISVFVTMIAALGLDEAIAYALPRYQMEQPGKVFTLVSYVLGSTAVIGALLGGLIYFTAEPLEALLNVDGIAADLKFVLWLTPALLLLAMVLAVLRGLGRAEWRAYIYYYLIGALFLAAVWLAMPAGLTSAEAYGARIGSVLCGTAVGLLLIWRELPRRGESLRLAELREVHSFGGWMIFVGVFQYAIDQPLLDLVLVGRYDTPVALGLYSVAAKIGAAAALAVIAFNVVMGPMFSRSLAAGAISDARENYRRASKWLAMATLFLGAILLLFHLPILALFGGEYLNAGRILQIFVLGQITAGLLGVNTPILLAAGFARVEFCLSAGACLFLILAGILLGQRFGTVGIAIASAASTVLLALARRRAVARVWRNISPRGESRTA